jgi:hypothetical protein
MEESGKQQEQHSYNSDFTVFSSQFGRSPSVINGTLIPNARLAIPFCINKGRPRTLLRRFQCRIFYGIQNGEHIPELIVVPLNGP